MSVITLLLIGGALDYFAILRRRLHATEQRLNAEIAERQDTESRLTEQETRLRTIIESEPECVKLHSQDGTILEMNPAGLAMLDAERPEEVIGTSVYKLIAPECRERYRAMTEAVFQGHSGSMEFRLLGLKGTERVHETHVVPLRSASGSILAVLALTRDVTDRRQAEQRAQRHLTELSRVGRLSTMAEMASGIAHELTQPLTAIINHVGACVRRLEAGVNCDEEAVKSLTQISAQAKRANQIIRSVRDMVRRDGPKKSLIDINEIAQTMVEFAEPEARQYGVHICLELAERLPLVCAERIEIEQVVLNLIRNGIEAMGETHLVQRDLTVTTRSDGENAVETLIRDTGPGIASEEIDTVFEPFFTTKAEGLGMGLSISRSIIESHGGHLSVLPNAGCGVTFRFALPTATEGTTP